MSYMVELEGETCHELLKNGKLALSGKSYMIILVELKWQSQEDRRCGIGVKFAITKHE